MAAVYRNVLFFYNDFFTLQKVLTLIPENVLCCTDKFVLTPKL